MGIKDIVKGLIAAYYSKRYKIQAGSGLYIGNDCKIINRGRIECGDHVTVRPSTHLYLSPGAEIRIGTDSEIGIIR